MIATPFSNEPYFPMILANGRDNVFVNYTGGTCGGHHSHEEQHQGATCGWYKTSYRAAEPRLAIQPLFGIGLHIFLFGADAEPRFYTQQFLPETATLETVLSIWENIKLRVVSFLNDDSIFCQTIELLACPPDLQLDLGFEVSMAVPCTNTLGFQGKTGFHAEPCTDTAHTFTYESGNTVRGSGFMCASRAYDSVSGGLGVFHDVKTGFSATRFVSCVDSSEELPIDETLEKRKRRLQSGLQDIQSAHAAKWGAFFDGSKIQTPDDRLNDLYKVSRYVLRANQHGTTGAITTGILPHLWRGGLYCGCDAFAAHNALLSCGNLAEGRAYVHSFLLHATKNKARLAPHGIKGTSFACWDDSRGAYTGTMDFVEYVTEYKPSFSGFAVFSVYWQYLYDPAFLTDEMLELVEDVVQFLLDVLIRTDGAQAEIKPVSAGTEAGFLVKKDTFNQIIAGRTMEMAGELLHNAAYTRIGKELLAGLADNYGADGVLYPFEGAPYTGGIQFLFYLYTLPHPIDIRSVDAALLRGKTPWGTNTEQTTEEYRHWPWNDSQAVICYAHDKQPEKAMEFLLHQPTGCSSLGALPEKIRIDGYPVGYWYTTSHAYLVAALNHAFAFTDEDGVIALGFGFDDRWQDANAENIALPGGTSVSYEIHGGTLVRVEIVNHSDKVLSLAWNYKNRIRNKTGDILPHGTYVWKS